MVGMDPEKLINAPELATSWTLSEDGQSVHFELRRGIKWSDGKPFSSEDVLFTFNIMMNSRVNAPAIQSYFKDFKSIEKKGDHAIVIHWKKKYFKMLDMVGGRGILPAHYYRKKYGLGDETSEAFADAFNKDNHLPSTVTGPFKFSKWETGQKVSLERNPLSWQKGLGNFDRLIYKVIRDRTAMRQQLKNGDIQNMSFSVQEYLDDRESPLIKKNYHIHDYYMASYSYIGYNMRKPQFSDAKVRKAFTHLMDREGIVKEIIHGYGKVVTGPFFFDTDFANPNITPIKKDVDLALGLLKEAGWEDRNSDGLLRNAEGKTLSMKVITGIGNPEREQAARLFVEACQRVGIDASFQYLEWSVLLDRVDNHEFDAVILGWRMGVKDPDPYQLWHSSQTKKDGSNFVGYVNEEVDRLIEENRECFDRKRRVEICHRIHEILHRDQPYTFLYSRKSFVPIHKSIQNQKVYPIGVLSDEWHYSK
jgi:peptide/nickel transport system substrate-binding protein